MIDFIDQKRAALLGNLRKNVDGEVRFDEGARKLYSTDASIYQIEPLGVVLPRSVAALQTAVQIALEMHVPIVPRGGGTTLSGQSIGPRLVIDFTTHLHQTPHTSPLSPPTPSQPALLLTP